MARTYSKSRALQALLVVASFLLASCDGEVPKIAFCTVANGKLEHPQLVFDVSKKFISIAPDAGVKYEVQESMFARGVLQPFPFMLPKEVVESATSAEMTWRQGNFEFVAYGEHGSGEVLIEAKNIEPTGTYSEIRSSVLYSRSTGVQAIHQRLMTGKQVVIDQTLYSCGREGLLARDL